MAPDRRQLVLSARQAKILVCLLGALVAAVDLSLPANINIATLYFILIVLAGWTRSASWVWGSTVIFIFLTFAGLIIAPAPVINAVTWLDWLNRSMTAVALAVAAVPVHLRARNLITLERSIADEQRAERALQESYNLLESRVQERTAALAQAAEELKKENA